MAEHRALASWPARPCQLPGHLAVPWGSALARYALRGEVLAWISSLCSSASFCEICRNFRSSKLCPLLIWVWMGNGLLHYQRQWQTGDSHGISLAALVNQARMYPGMILSFFHCQTPLNGESDQWSLSASETAQPNRVWTLAHPASHNKAVCVCLIFWLCMWWKAILLSIVFLGSEISDTIGYEKGLVLPFQKYSKPGF